MHFIIDPIAGFWETLFSGMSIQGPPISAESMAWITVGCGVITFLMFLDWLWGKFGPK